jgi:8-oxo-dGTP pyrophosphatase MutT (NUDIX family)
MDLSILSQKDYFPSFVSEKLSAISLDYIEKYKPIKQAAAKGMKQLGAGVVLLLQYKDINIAQPEYVFQLIKRSRSVSQAGDISCPGGMLHPGADRLLSFLLTARMLSAMPDKKTNFYKNNDAETVYLIRLFLTNALREAWEEIGLNPFNTCFLGALPCHSLLLFPRTIFPLVCLIRRPFQFQLSSEVDSIIEVPVSAFFDSSNYAALEIEMDFGNRPETQKNYHPCFIISGQNGSREILWGATYNIMMSFLRAISGNDIPLPTDLQKVKKVLSENYVTGDKQHNARLTNS